MMKKKWLVISGIILIVGAGILITVLNLIRQDQTLEVVTHSQTWVLDAKEIELIDVSGLDQVLTIEFSESDAPTTQVIFSGETTPTLQSRMEKISSQSNKLELDLVQAGFSISMKGKATDLKGTLQVILGKDVTLKSFKHVSIFADTFVNLPADMLVKTYPKTKDGQIETIEDDANAETSLKISSDSGNITIQKRD